MSLNWMTLFHKPFWLLLCLLAIPLWGAQVSYPRSWSAWSWTSGVVHFRPLPDLTRPVLPLTWGDLDGDGDQERISLSAGTVTLWRQSQPVWQSPADWQVYQAELADLNRDGRLELVLLVWRPFHPWPVDRVMPNSGRIIGHQDARGQSCQLILIGWERNAYRQVWAGSALARPVYAFASVDVNGDGLQELVALEGDYTHRQPAQSLAFWAWNGFGFDLLGRRDGTFSSLKVVKSSTGVLTVLTRN